MYLIVGARLVVVRMQPLHRIDLNTVLYAQE
jgi:hypothetical protein